MSEDLWKKWDTRKTSYNLRPLLNYYSDDINKRVNQFNNSDVPKRAREVKAKVLAVEAFKTYDPKKQASLRTHVYTHLKRLSRFVGDHQNIGKIPENRRLKITKFNLGKSELNDILGREPSILELSGKLQWPVKEVERMEAELQGLVVSSSRSDEGIDLLFNERGDQSKSIRLRQVIRNVYYELTPEEQIVYEYLTGMAGKPIMNETQIAKHLGTSITKISRVKQGIVKKIEKWT
jgi:DNA-directed RNA polymerase specialized sigma subunit